MSPVRLKRAADRADPVDPWHDGTGILALTLLSRRRLETLPSAKHVQLIQLFSTVMTN